MNSVEAQKIKRFIELLEEQRIITQRILHLGDELEKLLRARLSEEFEVLDPHDPS